MTNQDQPKPSPVVLVMGVSGSGKSTVAKAFARGLQLPYFDADDFHPQSNIQKMKAGIPLEDEDRIPWLKMLNQLLNQQNSGAVLACSALKQFYREIILEHLPKTEIVYLKGTYNVIFERMSQRNHFMPPELLNNQFETLEEPSNSINIDINLSVSEITKTYLPVLQYRLKCNK